MTTTGVRHPRRSLLFVFLLLRLFGCVENCVCLQTDLIHLRVFSFYLHNYSTLQHAVSVTHSSVKIGFTAQFTVAQRGLLLGHLAMGRQLRDISAVDYTCAESTIIVEDGFQKSNSNVRDRQNNIQVKHVLSKPRQQVLVLRSARLFFSFRSKKKEQ